MRVEDYDVTDLLAGYVELMGSESSEEQDSNIFDDESFFEKLDVDGESKSQKMSDF